MAVLAPETVNIPEQDVEIPTKPAHPILLEMAELIARRGWCQGTFEHPDGRLCVLGAFYKMLEQDSTWPLDDDWESPYYQALWAFERSIAAEVESDLETQFVAGWRDASDWNDTPRRSKLEVIDRLRRVGMLGR